MSIQEVFAFIGFALLVAGATVIYWPAGLLVAGALLLVASLIGLKNAPPPTGS